MKLSTSLFTVAATVSHFYSAACTVAARFFFFFFALFAADTHAVHVDMYYSYPHFYIATYPVAATVYKKSFSQ